jgi:hypothetical protein
MKKTWVKSGGIWLKDLDISILIHRMTAVKYAAMDEEYFPPYPESPVDLDIYFLGKKYKKNIFKVENDNNTRKSPLYRITFVKELHDHIKLDHPECSNLNKHEIESLNYKVLFKKKGAKSYELSINKGS